ncbi:hypothetical protein KCP71_02015 [Salmonella enterica subsp. enterica]|nr:hypothetical protein KCP71_02015 [Salmonella enterica subsp. enterica]
MVGPREGDQKGQQAYAGRRETPDKWFLALSTSTSSIVIQCIMPRNEFMLTSHSHLRHVTDTFTFIASAICCKLATGREKATLRLLTSIHHHDKHRGEVNVRLNSFIYHASCRQSGSRRNVIFWPLAELLPRRNRRAGP